jgi:hypothetical protein
MEKIMNVTSKRDFILLTFLGINLVLQEHMLAVSTEFAELVQYWEMDYRFDPALCLLYSWTVIK